MPIPNEGVPPEPSAEAQPAFTWELPPLELRILAGPSSARRDPRVLLGGVCAFFILTAIASPYLKERPAPGPAAETRPARDIPAPLRPTYDRAVSGDAGAMRLLGSMYFQGLSVPRDAREGIHWYRLAASAGNVEAIRDLEQLGVPLEN